MAIPAGASALGPLTNMVHQKVSGNPPIVGTGAPPVPVASVLQGGVVGVAYSESISAQGGLSPYAFSVTLGALPASLTLNPTTGVIAGTPSLAATSAFTIQVADTNGNVGTQAFSITISAQASVGSSFVFIG
jgi:large repetitive protein